MDTVYTPMLSADPIVTTVIPTYNRAVLLRRAIASAAAQTMPALRICVFDNASTDDTSAVVAGLAARDPRIAYVRHDRNLGATRNFHFGLSQVTTPYFSVLADDDVLLPEFYETALSSLQPHPDVGIYAGVTLQVDRAGVVQRTFGAALPCGVHEAPQGMLMLLQHDWSNWTGMLFSRSLLEAVALDDRICLADIDFLFRAAGLFPMVVTHDSVALSCTFSESISFRLSHSLVWPSWRYVTDKIATEARIPSGARGCAVALLDARLRALLPRMGWEALAHRQFEDARTIAEVLRGELGMRRQARLLVLASILSETSGSFNEGLRLAYRARRLVRRLLAWSPGRRWPSYAQYLR